MKTKTTHTFALIAPQEYQPLTQHRQKKSLTIVNKDFYFRICTILRLQVGDSCIIFDRYHHMTCIVESITKKEITFSIASFSENNEYKPIITCCIPLLKHEALETFIDSATQLGATTIQLITTQKTHRSTLQTKELERLQRIIYAAAEQSKNFNYPLLKAPELLETISFEDPTIFLDPVGQSFLEVVANYTNRPPSNITLIAGPEGDLTDDEKKLLTAKKVTFMALTPTVLRAEQAAALGLGMLRASFLTKKIDN